MPHSTPFTRRILLLAVLPIGLSTVLLLAGFAFAQKHQTDATKHAIAKMIENALTVSALNYSANPGALDNAANALLNIDPIINISLFDQNKSLIKSFGLPSNNSIQNFNSDNKVFSQHGGITFIAIPIKDNSHAMWLGASLRNDAFTIGYYRGYLLMFLAGVCTLLTTAYFATKLHNHIVNPLTKVITELKDAITHDMEAEISPNHSDLYNDLVDLLNRLLHIQRTMREEMQGHVDQSTKELRETLETVEIQNIELDMARKNALHASRTKSEFLANTSHELRTPLNGIIGFTALLLKTSLSDQQKDYLGTIEKSAQGLLTVINDILDFSRLETGQLTLEYKPIFIRELIEDIFSIYAPQANEKNIRLLSTVNYNIPHNLLGDPQRLKQVLSNLISNAIKFSNGGNIIVRAFALGEVDNHIEIKFTVADEGIGLSQEQQENLFNNLSKIDGSDSRTNGGTGLGLAIAKGLVDKMKGEIGVESRLHSGSDFWFTVRLGFDRQSPSESPLSNSLFGLHGLVIDTQAASRAEITHLLTEWGVIVTEVDSKEKIESLMSTGEERAEFQFAVMDACQDENGFNKEKILTCVHNLTEQFHLPTVVLAPSNIQRILQDGIVGFGSTLSSRPLNSGQLHQHICNLVSLKMPSGLADSSASMLRNQTAIRKNIKVLVVDDNAANRRLVSEFLKAIGTNVVVAEDGYRAVELISNDAFDLILMDVQMPGMDGLETTRLIRCKETTRRTPVVALTAHAVNERKTQLLLAGMDDFLSKPVSEEDLGHMIKRWVTENKTPEAKRSVPQVIASQNSPSQTPAMQTTSSAPPQPKSYEGRFSTTPPEVNSSPPDNLAIEFEPVKDDLFSWAESMQLARHKPDLATDMLHMLIKSLDEIELVVPRLTESNDYQQLEEVIHKFHGGCCYCGVPALRLASKRLELALHNKSVDLIPDLSSTLIKEVKRLKSWADQIDLTTLFADKD